MGNMRQNLVFAFIYHAVGVPIAAAALQPAFGSLLPPLIAVLAISFSSVRYPWWATRHLTGGKGSDRAKFPRHGSVRRPNRTTPTFHSFTLIEGTATFVLAHPGRQVAA